MTVCFHCGLPVPAQVDFSVCIDDVAQPMCCPGCQAVATTIIAAGLIDYYHMRDSVARTQNMTASDVVPDLDVFNDPDIMKTYITTTDRSHPNQCEIVLLIEGITCAACVWLIEKDLKSVPGIQYAEVNFSTQRLNLCWDRNKIQLSDIFKKIEKIGYQAFPYQVSLQEKQQKKAYRQALKRLAVAGLGMLQVMMYAAVLYAGYFKGMAQNYQTLFRVGSLVVVTPIAFYSGWPFLQGAWRAIKTRTPSMDLPISIAILLAYLASIYAVCIHGGEVYFDSIAMLIFFLTLGRFLEMVARQKTFKQLQFSQACTPNMATRITGNTKQSIALDLLKPGDTILVEPGAIIPVDGTLLSDVTQCNESILTGEQNPVTKQTGDKVIAGSQNMDNEIRIAVSRKSKDSMLSTIARLLERAQSEKPPMVALTQKLASKFVAAVLVIAIFSTLIWLYLDPSKAIWVTLSVLVITCPCALSLATPVALTVATNVCAKWGFLITRAFVCEGLAKATTVVFDKTGTLTEGCFSIEEIVLNKDVASTWALGIAAALESSSIHPIAKAFTHYQHPEGVELTNKQQVPGQGVYATLGETCYYLGHHDFIHAYTKLNLPEHPKTHGLWLALASQHEFIAWFCLHDKIRIQAIPMIQSLISQGLKVEMLTGDSSSLVAAVAKRLNIQTVTQQATPQTKLSHIQALQASGEHVIMVGDGLNDAPVLSAADVSIAMGGSSDLTLLSADAILLKNDLALLPTVFKFCKKTKTIIKENFVWAILYNGLALPLALCGWVTPYFAAIGMSLSSLIVVLNALRLKRELGK